MAQSTDEKRLILDNLRLVHYLVNNKCAKSQNDADYDDIISTGTIGLIKAAKTFDSSKEIKFATYASRCILNEIFIYFRKHNKYANDVSIYEPIRNDGEGKELTIVDVIEDPNANFVEERMIKDDFIHLVSIILNCLNRREKLLILYQMGNLTQEEMAEKLNLAQSSVSKHLPKAISKVRYVIDHEVPYNKVFSVDAIGDEYRISFLTKDIQNLSNISQCLTSVEDLPNLKVEFNEERIAIQLSADSNYSFYILAQIIQEIDDFNMTFVSGVYNTSMYKKENKSKLVREYMLTLDSFTVNELKQHFPNIHDKNTIKNVLTMAKKKGLITRISEGKYIVNKN